MGKPIVHRGKFSIRCRLFPAAAGCFILYFLCNLFSIKSLAADLKIPGKPELESISADSLKKHVEFLGSDALQGRATGSAGEKMAADYIADCLNKWEIKPGG